MQKIVLFFFCFVAINHGQQEKIEDYIFLNQSADVTISLDENSFLIRNNVNEKALFQSAKQLYFATHQIPFDR